MTTHTIDTTNSAGCSPCTPEAHQRSGDEKLREALDELWNRGSGFDPEILKLRHTAGNLDKIEHALIGLLGSLIETQMEIFTSREEERSYIEQCTWRDEAKAAYQKICESEERKFKATMDDSPLGVLIGEYVIRLRKRERKHWESGKESVFVPGMVLTLAWVVGHELSSIASICKDHGKRKLLRKVNSKPTRD